MATYSRNTAIARIQYAQEFHDAYAYVFAPTGGFGAWVGARPIFLQIHGGGWAQPDLDYQGGRYPANGMISSTSVPDKFADGGAIVVLVEYPLGAGLNTPSETGRLAARFPTIWLAFARLIQTLKDECGTGGILDSAGATPGDPAQIIAYGFSAGASTLLMGQWAPKSWGMIPRAPGAQAGLGSTCPRSDHYVKAMVLSGPPMCPASDDPSRKSATGAYSPIIAAVAKPWRYRPRVELFGTMTGTMTVGMALTGSGSTTEKGVVLAVSGSGAATTLTVALTKGYATDIGNAETFDGTGGTSFAGDGATAPVILDKYGWLDLPQRTREAISPALFIDAWDEADLDQVRSIPLFAFQTGNPSVNYSPSDSLTAKIANKYGADDAHDIQLLEDQLGDLTGFTTAFYWGDDVTTATITATHQILTDATNASPIVCTVAAEHGIRTGDSIKIGQALGNTAANGTWTATRLSSTQFSLQGSTGNGAYTSGGRWVFDNTTGNYCVGGSILQTFYDWLKNTVGVDLA